MENDSSLEIRLNKDKWPSVGNITAKDEFN